MESEKEVRRVESEEEVQGWSQRRRCRGGVRGQGEGEVEREQGGEGAGHHINPQERHSPTNKHILTKYYFQPKTHPLTISNKHI